jgi:hypothetical protein
MTSLAYHTTGLALYPIRRAESVAFWTSGDPSVVGCFQLQVIARAKRELKKGRRAQDVGFRGLS